MTRRPFIVVLAVMAAVVPVAAEEPISNDIGWQIRREGTERSQVMQTLHVLTDVYGPRLTGSPNLTAAAEWAARQLTAWGLRDARLEPWDFGKVGWVNDRFSGFIVSPVRDTLVGEVVAWTPGTDGAVTGRAVQVDPPEQPTQQELTDWFARVKDVVRGRIVLVGPPKVVPVSFNPPAKRRDEAELRAQYDPVNPAPSPFAARMTQAQARQPGPGQLTTNEITRQTDEFLAAQGALVRLNDAGREHGQVRAFGSRTSDPAKAVPTVVLRNEDYGRIARLLAGGRDVELEFAIVNRLFPEGKTQHNVLAEIPGTDKAGEVVMLGAHLDSWHAATGATDNGIGCAVMMEAARILQAIGARPRRTIRLALWSGEEQGLLGSTAYVKRHFGTFENPTPAFDTLVAYFNIDMGTGRARGMSVFGPPEAAAVVRVALAPFEDLGLVGTVATTSRRRGGSDHTSFNAAGLPGIGVGQDPIEYGSHTWHTNLDTYERIIPADAQRSAIAVAAAVYHLAMREAPLPRLPKDQMPAPPRAEDEEPAARPPQATAGRE